MVLATGEAILIGLGFLALVLALAWITVSGMKYKEKTTQTPSPIFQFMILAGVGTAGMVFFWLLHDGFKAWINDRPYLFLSPMAVSFAIFILPEIQDKIFRRKKSLQRIEEEVLNLFAQRLHGGFSPSHWAVSPFIAMKRTKMVDIDGDQKEVVSFLFQPKDAEEFVVSLCPYKLEILNFHTRPGLTLKKEIFEKELGVEKESEVKLREAKLKEKTLDIGDK